MDCIGLYQSVANILEYSNIGIFLSKIFIRKFVRVKFVSTNIFGHSLVIVLECKTKTNIRIYSNIRTIFNTNTYSGIRLCQMFYTNIFGYLFV